jgi:hypothetical protein
MALRCPSLNFDRFSQAAAGDVSMRMRPLVVRSQPRWPGRLARGQAQGGSESQGAESPIGIGDGDDPRSPANRGRGWGSIPDSQESGTGMGMIPDLRQIGDRTPIPIPGQIGDGDGGGDRGFRTLGQSSAPGGLPESSAGRVLLFHHCVHAQAKASAAASSLNPG